jgi:hypothetical protein
MLKTNFELADGLGTSYLVMQLHHFKVFQGSLLTDSLCICQSRTTDNFIFRSFSRPKIRDLCNYEKMNMHTVFL